jgi:nucleoside-diphosphate-sugar epimerase
VRGWRDAQAPIDRVAAGERQVDGPDFGHAIDWTWIDDAGEVLLRAVERPLPRCAALNVAGDKRTMADLIAHLKRRAPDLVGTRVPAQTNPAARSLANDGLAALLGYAPSTTLEQGIDRMLGRADATTAAPRARS